MCDDFNEAKKPECVFIEYDHSCISAVRGMFETWSPACRLDAEKDRWSIARSRLECHRGDFRIILRVVMGGGGHRAAIALEVRSRLPSLL